MRIALDATYSLGRNLSGVGVYSREILQALATLRPEVDWRWLYRAHRFRNSLAERLPASVHRGLLVDTVPFRSSPYFHGLNQRLPPTRFRRQVVTFHDLFVMTAEFSTPEFRARFTEQARHAALTADRIIAVSEFTAAQAGELLGIEPARVTVIPHGLRPLSLPRLTKENVVLHVGAIQKRKNLVRLVHAFRSLSERWQLVLAGSDGYGAADVHRAIQSSPYRDRITVTGYLSVDELASWYSRAKIFAFPSLGEGFGMPVLEAMGAGIPVLTSRGSALTDVAGNAAILVDPEREDEIATALQTLAADEDLRNALVGRGLKRVLRYTWERAAVQTCGVYDQVFE